MSDLTKRIWFAVDVGNSRVKAGLFVLSGEPLRRSLPDCQVHFNTSLDDGLPWEKLLAIGARSEDGAGHGDETRAEAVPSLCGVVVGSNQQGVDRIAGEWTRNFDSELLVIRDSQQFPLEIDVEAPQKVGLDRLLNAIAVNSVREPSRAAIVVDCGTATTIDLVTADGTFRGGAILPGFALCAKAMHHYTEVLPFISIDQIVNVDAESAAHPPLGRNTQAAMMSGVFWGQIGAIRELIHRIGESLSDQFDIVLTGGGSRLLAPHFPDATHYPYLPLQGLIVAAEAQDS